MSAIASGTGAITYKFVVNEGNKSTIIQNYSKNNVVDWTPTKAGIYTIYVACRDESGKVVSKYFTYVVTESKQLQITNFKPSVVSPQKVGTEVNLTSNALGTGTLIYKFVVNEGNKSNIIQNYSKNNNVNWKPTKAGIYTIYVACRDDSGKVVSKYFIYVIE